jgi:hypothetical protein
MPDIYLRSGATNPDDIILRDPTAADGGIVFSGVGDSAQDEQTDVGLGMIVGGAVPAVPAVSAGGRRGRIRIHPAPVYIRQRIAGRSDSGQSLQFCAGAGSIWVVRRGAGDSAQRQQWGSGTARLTFEAITERELLELIMIEAA